MPRGNSATTLAGPAACLLLGITLLVVAAALFFRRKPGRAEAQDRVQAAEARLTKSAAKTLAYTCTGKTWSTKPLDNWTNGFMTGCWWKMYALTDQAAWKTLAEQGTAKLMAWKDRDTTHDIGFVIMCSFGNAPAKNAEVITTAAANLAKRYVPKLGLIQSWGKIGDAKVQVIIDTMMNLKLLYEAAKLPGGKPEWATIATKHATTTTGLLVRSDGSTYHKAVFQNGTRTLGTHQGAGNGTTWARGQAWALYGFADAYEYTRNALFKRTAEKVAKYFIDNLPSDNVPYWDFQAPKGKRYKDTSAAAIAACGLFKLGKATGTAAYTAKANAILDSLSRSYPGSSKGLASLLCCACVNVPRNEGIGVGYVVADYYYLEALQLAR